MSFFPDLRIISIYPFTLIRSLLKRISKYQIRPLYNLCKVEEALGKIKERISSSSVKNSSNNSSESNLFKKARIVLLCLRAKVLIQESRSIYFIRYKLFFLSIHYNNEKDFCISAKIGQ